jgi:hypothetical protein
MSQEESQMKPESIRCDAANLGNRLGRRVAAFAVIGSLTVFHIHAYAGQGVQGHVIEVNIPVSGAYVRFQLDVPPVNPDGCGPTTNQPGIYMIEIASGSTSADRFIATLLTASATGKSANFWITGCTVGQYWGGTRPTAYDIYLY